MLKTRGSRCGTLPYRATELAAVRRLTIAIHHSRSSRDIDRSFIFRSLESVVETGHKRIFVNVRSFEISYLHPDIPDTSGPLDRPKKILLPKIPVMAQANWLRRASDPWNLLWKSAPMHSNARFEVLGRFWKPTEASTRRK
jgi:hypothetical protein